MNRDKKIKYKNRLKDILLDGSLLLVLRCVLLVFNFLQNFLFLFLRFTDFRNIFFRYFILESLRYAGIYLVEKFDILRFLEKYFAVIEVFVLAFDEVMQYLENKAKKKPPKKTQQKKKRKK